jgi:hypothetical protein
MFAWREPFSTPTLGRPSRGPNVNTLGAIVLSRRNDDPGAGFLYDDSVGQCTERARKGQADRERLMTGCRLLKDRSLRADTAKGPLVWTQRSQSSIARERSVQIVDHREDGAPCPSIPTLWESAPEPTNPVGLRGLACLIRDEGP